MRSVFAVLLIAPWLVACDNSCQSLCVNMAEYSKECGNKVPQAQIDACLTDFASVEPEEARSCRDFGTPDAIRREWTCEDVNLYRESVDQGSDGAAAE